MKLFTWKPPWYAAGLAFECEHCGRCCAGPEEGYVWVTPQEIVEIARFLELPPEQVQRWYVRKVRRRFSIVEREDNKDCIFLSADAGGGAEKGCLIYPVRPGQCRSWPFWPQNISNPDAWAIAGARCRGINRGKLHSLEEIERLREAGRQK